MTEPTSPAGSDGADPSMEEILASIRRILNEDEAPAGSEEAAATETETDEDILVLDRSMLVRTPEAAADAVEPSHPAPPETSLMNQPIPEPPPLRSPPGEPLTFETTSPAPSTTLVAPETAAAAASSVDGLLRTLAASRSSQVYRGGPTIEDMVREEIRPLLKDWLDNHLPPLVERLVRAEIERVVGRAVS